jgi:hydrogenase nickel incorporation protein HypA/HybF
MHEFSITTSIVETILDLAKKQEAQRVLEAHLRIGKLRALSSEQVKFCYDVLAKGTPLEGSKLIIEEVNGRVRCNNCSYHEEFNSQDDTYHFGIPTLVCPLCGSPMVIEGGDELIIAKVRMMLPTSISKSAVQ